MTAAPASARAARGAATVAKLLDAAASILKMEGAAGVSVQRIADVAGTSKGLVHYHFPDKDALLSACAERLTTQLVEADRFAIAASTPESALDDLWKAFEASSRAGTRRALAALTADATPATRAALAASAQRRRDAACATFAQLEPLLGVSARIPRTALAAAFVALTDGLALDPSANRASHIRPAYDAFWLAVLTVGSE
jgi:AcrR family transcriptional regulator